MNCCTMNRKHKASRSRRSDSVLLSNEIDVIVDGTKARCGIHTYKNTPPKSRQSRGSTHSIIITQRAPTCTRHGYHRCACKNRLMAILVSRGADTVHVYALVVHEKPDLPASPHTCTCTPIPIPISSCHLTRNPTPLRKKTSTGLPFFP